jgi:hypothetical protein
MTENTQETTKKSPITVVKSNTRLIRKTIMAFFKEITAGMSYSQMEARLKEVKLDEFVQHVLAIDHEWPIKAKADAIAQKAEGIEGAEAEKFLKEAKALLQSHRSWYVTAYKKLPEQQALKALEAPAVETPASETPQAAEAVA